METDEPFHEGFLLLPPSGKILKKSWQRKYCLLYKRSSIGIRRIEIYDTEAKTGQVKIITLEDVIKITPKPPNVFSIVTKSADYEFGTLSEDLFNVWFTAIQNVIFPDAISQLNGIEEDNDLYCSTDEGVFYVKLHPSEASKRCGLANKNYTLILTTTALQLLKESDSKLLYTWPYCYIRRYGYKHGKFTFEAGRKCASGEGTFYLEHPNQHEIYRCLSSKMKNMKKFLKSESTSSLLDCGDAHLQAAVHMEPGSRSPFPLSSTTSNQSSNLTSHFSLSTQSLECSGIVKSTPQKPPRKSISSKNISEVLPVIKVNLEHDYQDVNPFSKDDRSDYSKYADVEKIRDAWRTMGVDDPSHTEQPPSDQEEDYVSWGLGTLTKSASTLKLIEESHAPAVITEPIKSSEDQYYDHLNFFGSSSRLNVSSGYKQVILSPVSPVTTPPSNNLYDEVQVMTPARSADDSHLGYALIRKDGASGTLKIEAEKTSSKQNVEGGKETEKVIHQLHNDALYAVISKPKQV